MLILCFFAGFLVGHFAVCVYIYIYIHMYIEWVIHTFAPIPMHWCMNKPSNSVCLRILEDSVWEGQVLFFNRSVVAAVAVWDHIQPTVAGRAKSREVRWVGLAVGRPGGGGWDQAVRLLMIFWVGGVFFLKVCCVLYTSRLFFFFQSRFLLFFLAVFRLRLENVERIFYRNW